MPISVTCGSCNSQFNAPDDSAGKRTKCPQCGGIIQIPIARAHDDVLDAVEEPASAFSDADYAAEHPAEAAGGDRQPCPMCGEMIPAKAIKCRYCGELLDKSMEGVVRIRGDVSDPGWSKVRAGLSTLYNCIVVLFATFVMMLVAGAIMGAAGAAANAGPRHHAEFPAGFAIVFGIGGLVCLGAMIGMIVGQARCASVPESSGARGFATGAIVCMVANILLSMFGGASQSQAINGIGSLLGLIGSILFILFIRRSALYLNNQELAASAMRFLIFGVCIVGGAFVLGVLSVAMATPVLIIIVVLAVLVASIVGVVWYLRLLKSLMTTIDQSMGLA